MPRDGFSALDFKQVAAPADDKAKAEKFAAITGEKPVEAGSKITVPPLTGDAARLAKITATLKAVIDRETDFLHQRRTKEARALHGEKARLMAQYKELVGKLRVNEAALGPKDSPQRKYIRKLTDGMRDSLKVHARVVLRMKAVTEGLIKSVGNEVHKKQNAFVGYGKSANYEQSSGLRPTSLSLNQVI